MTIREVFDKVRDHLLSQNERCTDGTVCLYRNKKGQKCAIGCLIMDFFYRPEFEGKLAGDSNVVDALKKSGVKYGAMEPMVRRLQNLHDRHPAEDWASKLVEIEKEFITGM